MEQLEPNTIKWNMTQFEHNWLGITPRKCKFCGSDLSFFATIPYCDYKCNHKQIMRYGVDVAMRKEEV